METHNQSNRKLQIKCYKNLVFFSPFFFNKTKCFRCHCCRNGCKVGVYAAGRSASIWNNNGRSCLRAYLWQNLDNAAKDDDAAAADNDKKSNVKVAPHRSQMRIFHIFFFVVVGMHTFEFSKGIWHQFHSTLGYRKKIFVYFSKNMTNFGRQAMRVYFQNSIMIRHTRYTVHGSDRSYV